MAVAVIACGFLVPAAFATTGEVFVVQDTTLTETQRRTILVMATGVTLDCAGHRIIGPGFAGFTRGSVTSDLCRLAHALAHGS